MGLATRDGLGSRRNTERSALAVEGPHVVSWDVIPQQEKNYRHLREEGPRPLPATRPDQSSGASTANEERMSLAERGPVDLVMAPRSSTISRSPITCRS
jgi:hypothetical protein